jgi:hypothetical protein
MNAEITEACGTATEAKRILVTAERWITAWNLRTGFNMFSNRFREDVLKVCSILILL